MCGRRHLAATHRHLYPIRVHGLVPPDADDPEYDSWSALVGAAGSPDEASRVFLAVDATYAYT